VCAGDWCVWEREFLTNICLPSGDTSGHAPARDAGVACARTHSMARGQGVQLCREDVRGVVKRPKSSASNMGKNTILYHPHNTPHSHSVSTTRPHTYLHTHCLPLSVPSRASKRSCARVLFVCCLATARLWTGWWPGLIGSSSAPMKPFRFVALGETRVKPQCSPSAWQRLYCVHEAPC
jgi:hypothetical protein